MNELKRTAHTVYDLKYHFVWRPKYRQKLLKGKVKAFVQETLRRIAREYGWAIDEMAIQSDHVHLLMHVPPKYSPARVAQIMKSISAREVFRQYPELRRKLWAGEFWGDGYFVWSVGDKVTTEIIQTYICYQQDDDDAPKQLGLWD